MSKRSTTLLAVAAAFAAGLVASAFAIAGGSSDRPAAAQAAAPSPAAPAGGQLQFARLAANGLLEQATTRVAEDLGVPNAKVRATLDAQRDAVLGRAVAAGAISQRLADAVKAMDSQAVKAAAQADRPRLDRIDWEAEHARVTRDAAAQLGVSEAQLERALRALGRDAQKFVGGLVDQASGAFARELGVPEGRVDDALEAVRDGLVTEARKARRSGERPDRADVERLKDQALEDASDELGVSPERIEGAVRDLAGSFGLKTP